MSKSKKKNQTGLMNTGVKTRVLHTNPGKRATKPFNTQTAIRALKRLG